MELPNIIEELSSTCIKMQRKEFPKGSIITTYMEKRKQICILLSGKADLIRYDFNGNKDIIERFNSHDIFGEAFYPVNTNNELFVLATEKCEVLLFLYDDIHIKCKNNCKNHNLHVSSLLELILNNAIHQNTRIEILSKRTIRDKLLTYFSILSTKSNLIISFFTNNQQTCLSTHLIRR